MMCNKLEDSLTLISSNMTRPLALPAGFPQTFIVPIGSCTTALITRLLKSILVE